MPSSPDLTLDDFDYALPPELIAQAPLPQRSASRLLAVDGGLLEDEASAICPSCCTPATCWCSMTHG
jgi:S-adenosylmethionine:tRNA ribosyltransferase-isomerase